MINLVSPWSSLPNMLKLSGLVLCPVWRLFVCMGDGSFRCSLYLSPGFWKFPLCILHCNPSLYIGNCRWHCFCIPWGPDPEVWPAIAWCWCFPWSMSVPNTYCRSWGFPQSLYIGYHYVSCARLVLVGPDFCVCRIVMSLCWVSLVVVGAILLLVVVIILILYFIYGPPRVFGLCQGLSAVFQPLIKKLQCGTYSVGPMGKGTNDTVLRR